MPELIVSIVVYRSPLPVLDKTLACLRQAGECAVGKDLIAALRVTVVDNASGGEYSLRLEDLLCRHQARGLELRLIQRPNNGGYGRGHNEVATGPEDFRLVLNPDVFLAPMSLVAGLEFLHNHPEVGVIAPWGEDEQGRPLFLSKRYPSVWVLGLRGLAPAWLKRRFASFLAEYEMRDLDWSRPQFGLPMVSGCCLLLRGRVWQEIGGFDPGYFLYFEDFDFALRAQKLTQIAYAPGFRIIHLGGGAARKGLWHQIWFLSSAFKFFRRHGWRWI